MNGVINIIGEIGKDVFLDNIKSQVKNQPKAESFTVNIDSVGGDLFEGYEIYDYIKNLKQAKRTKGLGVVASISSLIFLAGDEREVTAGTKFLCHYPRISNLNDVTADDLKVLSDIMVEFNDWLAHEYVGNTGLDYSAVSAIMKSDDFIDTKDLLEWGFTTKGILKLTAKATINKDEMKKDKKDWKYFLAKINKALDIDVSNKLLYSADQKEVEFPDLDEEEQVEIDSRVLVDGDALEEGEVVLADGRTIKIIEGKVAEIIEKEEEEAEEVAVLEAKIKDALEKNKEIKLENKSLLEEKKSISDKFKEAESTLKEIQEYGSKFIAQGKRDNKSKTPKKKAGSFDEAYNNLNK